MHASQLWQPNDTRARLLRQSQSTPQLVKNARASDTSGLVLVEEPGMAVEVEVEAGFQLPRLRTPAPLARLGAVSIRRPVWVGPDPVPEGL